MSHKPHKQWLLECHVVTLPCQLRCHRCLLLQLELGFKVEDQQFEHFLVTFLFCSFLFFLNVEIGAMLAVFLLALLFFCVALLHSLLMIYFSWK